MSYKGWSYIVKGYSGCDKFTVKFTPDPSVNIEFSKRMADYSFHEQFRKRSDYIKNKRKPTNCNESGYLLLTSHIDFLNGQIYDKENPIKSKDDLHLEWFKKLSNICMEVEFTNPPRLFCKYSQRVAEVEIEAKKYIDNKLNDFIIWLQNNLEIIM